MNFETPQSWSILEELDLILTTPVVLANLHLILQHQTLRHLVSHYFLPLILLLKVFTMLIVEAILVTFIKFMEVVGPKFLLMACVQEFHNEK